MQMSRLNPNITSHLNKQQECFFFPTYCMEYCLTLSHDLKLITTPFSSLTFIYFFPHKCPTPAASRENVYLTATFSFVHNTPKYITVNEMHSSGSHVMLKRQQLICTQQSLTICNMIMTRYGNGIDDLGVNITEHKADFQYSLILRYEIFYIYLISLISHPKDATTTIPSKYFCRTSSAKML